MTAPLDDPAPEPKQRWSSAIPEAMDHVREALREAELLRQWRESSGIPRRRFRKSTPERPVAVVIDAGTHQFVYEQDTNGHTYGFCPRCRRYEADCQANGFHDAIPCSNSESSEGPTDES